MSLYKNLNKPYYSNTNIAYRLLQAFLFGSFVSVFLIIFKPFSISELGPDLRLVALGFGAVTLMVMVTLSVVLPLFLRAYFNAENWTLKKEIIHSALNLVCIGAGNGLFYLKLIAGSFSWELFFSFQFYTFCIGIMPIVFVSLYKERKDYKQFSAASELINSDLQQNNYSKSETDEQLIIIPSKNKNEDLRIKASDVLVIHSMDNYLEVYSTDSKVIVRNTLKNIEKHLIDKPIFYRCHKSYIVNLNKVKSISGNAQGYKLSIEDYPKDVPVSRSLNQEIKQKLLSFT